LEDAFNYADQLGQRKGAGAAYLNIFHQDVIEFLDTKKITADEKSRLQSLSIGLIAENIFFDLAERDEDMHVFGPHSVFKAYNVHLDDMDLDEMYYELLNNQKLIRRN
jgi:ribonucleoside-diphosphate reductase alpha chain